MNETLAKELLEKTRNDYNLIIEDFSRSNYNLWPELFAIFADYIKNGDRILDVGCGIGRLLEAFSGKSLVYTGVDGSVGQLQEAKKRHPEREFLLANAIDLPFADASFDKVFLISILHHVPGREFQKRVLSETVRILKPGGVLFLSVWRPNLKIMLKSVLKYSLLKILGKSKFDWFDVMIPWRSGKTERYYHLFQQGEIEQLAKEASLAIIKFGIVRSEKGKRRNLYLIAQKSP